MGRSQDLCFSPNGFQPVAHNLLDGLSGLRLPHVCLDQVVEVRASAKVEGNHQSDHSLLNGDSAAIAKVKDIMAEFNLTIEHLTQTVAGKRAAKKTKAKSASVAKYADPKTGKTWS